MKLTKIALGVSLGLSTLALKAADVAMFPYVVNSPTVTTIVTVVDRGIQDTGRYDASGNASKSGNRLHWRLNYKASTATADPSNDANCQSVDAYLPTSPDDIQTVDLGAAFSGSDKGGVLFNDPSVNNNWAGANYGLTKQASSFPLRGVLFVHNSDASDDYNTSHSTVQGEAMVFQFENGAAWGYSAEVRDGGGLDDAEDFSFAEKAQRSKAPVVAFMPLDQVKTRLFVTPVDNWGSMLDKGGKDVAGWNSLSVKVGLRGRDPTGSVVAFDRDENPISGAVDAGITCVGGVDVSSLMTTSAQGSLADGGYGVLAITPGTTENAVVYKLEYTDGKAGVSFNGKAPVATGFNNAIKL